MVGQLQNPRCCWLDWWLDSCHATPGRCCFNICVTGVKGTDVHKLATCRPKQRACLNFANAICMWCFQRLTCTQKSTCTCMDAHTWKVHGHTKSCLQSSLATDASQWAKCNENQMKVHLMMSFIIPLCVLFPHYKALLLWEGPALAYFYVSYSNPTDMSPRINIHEYVYNMYFIFSLIPCVSVIW